MFGRARQISIFFGFLIKEDEQQERESERENGAESRKRKPEIE